MRMKHRILSLVLTVCLVAGLLPTTVFAATVGGFEVVVQKVPTTLMQTVC